MKRMMLCSLVVAFGIIVLAPAAEAHGVCAQLWFERNSIFKEHGYCFKTARAIRQFGNAGCQVDDERDLRMSRGQRARVAAIIREEREAGCR